MDRMGYSFVFLILPITTNMILQNKKKLKKSSIQEINPFIYSIDNNLEPNICDQLISLFDIPSLQKYINEKEDLYTNEISKSLIEEDNNFKYVLGGVAIAALAFSLNK